MDEETGAKEVKKDEIDGGMTDEDKANRQKAKQAYIDLAGKDGEIDAYEFMDFLNKVFPIQGPNCTNGFKTDGFSADMTRTMVALEDTDITGKLGYEEFKKIWTDLVLCTKVFRKLDTDGTGYFSTFELRTAFLTLGFTISNATFAAIAIRHSDKEGRISFDDFILCFLQLKSAFTQFSHKDPPADGRAVFQYEEFLKMTMYS